MAAVVTAPGRLPLLGHAWPLLRHRIGFFQKLRSYGDIVAIYQGARPAYVLNSPELIRRVLVEEAGKFERGRVFDKIRPLAGNGLATSDGVFHQRQRRIMQPAFSRARIAGYAEIMRTETATLADQWEPGQSLVVDKEMTELAVSIAARVLCATGLTEEAVHQVRWALPVMLNGVMLNTLVPGDFFERLPLPVNRRFQRAMRTLRHVVDEVIHAYQTEGVDHGDLLSMLVAARYEDGAAMTAEQVRNEVMTILMAGTATTAGTLSWLFYELDRNPEIMRRLHDEIDTVLAGRPVTFPDIEKLPYLDMVLNEAIRRYSPIWMFMRRATMPVELGDVTVRPGTEVVLSMSTLHRDPELYPDPLRFDPDRWADGKASVLSPKCAFIPFAAGEHKCIGDHFAWTEMAVAMVTICSRWRLRLAPNHEVREIASITLRPDALPMTVEPRSTPSRSA